MKKLPVEIGSCFEVLEHGRIIKLHGPNLRVSGVRENRHKS